MLLPKQYYNSWCEVKQNACTSNLIKSDLQSTEWMKFGPSAGRRHSNNSHDESVSSILEYNIRYENMFFCIHKGWEVIHIWNKLERIDKKLVNVMITLSFQLNIVKVGDWLNFSLIIPKFLHIFECLISNPFRYCFHYWYATWPTWLDQVFEQSKRDPFECLISNPVRYCFHYAHVILARCLNSASATRRSPPRLDNNNNRHNSCQKRTFYGPL